MILVELVQDILHTVLFDENCICIKRGVKPTHIGIYIVTCVYMYIIYVYNIETPSFLLSLTWAYDCYCTTFLVTSAISRHKWQANGLF